MKSKIIIGLVGESGSGKDTAANYLAEKYGAALLRFADPIKESLNLFFDRSSKEDQQWMFLEFQKRLARDVLHRALRKKIENLDGLIVINGLRMPQDPEFVRGFENSHILYITAGQKMRWERSFRRGEKSDDSVSFEKFQQLEKAETEAYIPEIGEKADFVIRNEGMFEDFLKAVDEVMVEIIK